MRFTELAIPGVFLIDPEPHADLRGSFARLWCVDEVGRRGLAPVLDQVSLSFNARRGTLRGMHLQREPAGEDKVVFCLTGAIHDVVLDLREGSPTYRRWEAVELTRARRRLLYIPRGCAHGFQTLEDETEVLYLISTPYSPEHASGVRWDDPAFGIEWPQGPRILSDKDRAWPLHQERPRP